MQEADDLGIVITPDMARSAEQFNDNISRLSKQMSGMFTMITANLAPVMVRLSDTMVGIANGFRNLSPVMQTFIPVAAGALVVPGPLLTGLGLMMMGAAPLVAAMAKVALAIKGVSLATLANPIGLAVAAIVGAAYLIYQEWDKVGPWFSSLWDGVNTTFSGFKDFVVGVFSGDLTGALAGIRTAWDGLSSFFGDLWRGIVGVFDYAGENGIKKVTDDLGATDQIVNGWNNVKSMFDTVMGAVGKAFDAAWKSSKCAMHGLRRVEDNAGRIIDNLLNQQAGGNNRAGNGPISFAPVGAEVAAGLARGTAAIADQGEADADGYLTRFRNRFGIQSPSRVMMDYVRFMSQGLGIGIGIGIGNGQGTSRRQPASSAIPPRARLPTR